VHSIIVTLCCCPLFGIIAIVFATQVNSKRDMGDIPGALEASRKAKMWFMIALGSGVLLWILSMLLWGAWFVAILGAAASGGAQ